MGVMCENETQITPLHSLQGKNLYNVICLYIITLLQNIGPIFENTYGKSFPIFKALAKAKLEKNHHPNFLSGTKCSRFNFEAYKHVELFCFFFNTQLLLYILIKVKYVKSTSMNVKILKKHTYKCIEICKKYINILYKISISHLKDSKIVYQVQFDFIFLLIF